MKYYIASKFKRRFFLREIRTTLAWLGHEVTSTWLDEELDFESLTQSEKRAVADRDYKQITESGVLIIDCEEPLSEGAGGGRENELGFAHGRGMCTIRIGKAYNPFHLKCDYQLRNWDHFIDWIQKEGEHKDDRRKKG